MDTPGKKTSEFQLSAAVCLLAALTGLTVQDGNVSFKFSMDIVYVVGALTGVYTGSRTALKAVTRIKNGSAVTAESVAVEVLKQLKGTK